MTLKTSAEWAREIFTDFSCRKGIRHELDAWEAEDIESLRSEVLVRVEAIRTEFAAAAAEEFQKAFGVKTASKAHNTAILACCFAVERLAKPTPAPKLCHPDCTYECCEVTTAIVRRSTVNTVDFRGVQIDAPQVPTCTHSHVGYDNVGNSYCVNCDEDL